MQDRLRTASPGLLARLLARADDGSATETWMETYALPGSSGGIDAGLEAGIESAAAEWRDLVAGPRHVEAFVVAGD